MSTQSHEPRVKNSICLFYKIAQQGSEYFFEKMSENNYQRLQIFIVLENKNDKYFQNVSEAC